MKNRRTLTMSAIVAGTLLTSLAIAATPTKEQEVLMQMERDNTRHWLTNDAAAVAAFEADEYTYTDPDGLVSDKNTDIAILEAGTTKLTVFDVDDMKAMVFGDTGVVVGRTTWKGQYLGIDISGVFRFTTTYIKRDGRWQCVASQITRIAKP